MTNKAFAMSASPMPGWRLALSAIAVATLSACSFMPKYERPTAPVAAQFPSSPASAPMTQSSTRPATDVAWQDFFLDPRLRRLIEISLANNRDLRIAVLNVEQARATFQIRRADIYPTINAAAASNRQFFAGNAINTYTVGLAVSAFELDLFGRLRSLSDAALATYFGTQEGAKAAQISLVSSVAVGYLNLLADEELIALSEQTLGTRNDSLKLTQLRFDNGASSELDLRQAQSLVENAKGTLAAQRRQRLLDIDALTLLLGQPMPADLPAGHRLDEQRFLADLPAGLPSEVLANRPDIRQAEQQLIAANANIGAARAAFFPRISLTASAGTASTDLSGLFKGGSYAWTGGPTISLPIFDAGRNQANLDSAKVSRDLAVAQYERAIQSAFRDVSDALAGRDTLSEQLRAQRAQADAEGARYKLSDLRYKNGVASYLDLLDAQRSLYTVQQAAITTQATQLQNLVTLYRVLGGGWTQGTSAIESPAQASTTSMR